MLKIKALICPSGRWSARQSNRTKSYRRFALTLQSTRWYSIKRTKQRFICYASLIIWTVTVVHKTSDIWRLNTKRLPMVCRRLSCQSGQTENRIQNHRYSVNWAIPVHLSDTLKMSALQNTYYNNNIQIIFCTLWTGIGWTLEVKILESLIS